MLATADLKSASIQFKLQHQLPWSAACQLQKLGLPALVAAGNNFL